MPLTFLSSCPDLFRASTFFVPAALKNSWMAGTSPAMTT